MNLTVADLKLMRGIDILRSGRIYWEGFVKPKTIVPCIDTVEEKECRCCGKVKPIDEYYKTVNNYNYEVRNYYCKTCCISKSKAIRKTYTPEQIKEYEDDYKSKEFLA